MQKQWKSALYSTELTVNHEEGWAALRLHKQAGGQDSVVAKIIFWDAEGQFVLEPSSAELPLNVVEDFISEARATIKTK